MAQTVLNIIHRSLRMLNVEQTGEDSDSDEVQDAFTTLNMMLGQWNNKRLMLFGFTNEVHTLTVGTGVYSIGYGGDIDTNRPTKIDRAFIRYNFGSPTNCTDYKLEIVPNDKYQELFLKKYATTYPIYLMYNNTFPLGEITLYPYPSQACQLGLSTWAQISKFTNVTQDIDLPDGYESALAYNLAVEMSPEYRRGLDPMIKDKAAETMSDIMAVNQQLVFLKAEGVLVPRKVFNLFTGMAR